ncbi:hypothetical protein HDU96_008248 [Phlyctochytrium bullatum]|nr:hypothetical protein HDU96_008248 [Phlyctochytrium bullatum]
MPPSVEEAASSDDPVAVLTMPPSIDTTTVTSPDRIAGSAPPSPNHRALTDPTASPTPNDASFPVLELKADLLLRRASLPLTPGRETAFSNGHHVRAPLSVVENAVADLKAAPAAEVTLTVEEQGLNPFLVAAGVAAAAQKVSSGSVNGTPDAKNGDVATTIEDDSGPAPFSVTEMVLSPVPLPTDADATTTTTDSAPPPTTVAQDPTSQPRKPHPHPPVPLASPDRLTPDEFLAVLTHRFLHTMVIDVSTSRSSQCSIPGSRRLVYVQRVRSRMERRLLVDPALRKEVEERKRKEEVGGPVVGSVVENGVVNGETKTTEESEGVGNDFARVELPPLPNVDLEDLDDEDDDSDLPHSFSSSSSESDSDSEDPMDSSDADGDAIMSDSPRKQTSPLSRPPRTSLFASRAARKSLLDDLDYFHLCALEPWDLTQVSDLVFHRRIDSDVVVYDDEGRDRGFAAAFAEVLRGFGRCRSVRFLSGGMRAFKAKYPVVCKPVGVVPLEDNGHERALHRTPSDPSWDHPTPQRRPTRRSTTVPDLRHFPHLPRTTSSVHDLREVQSHLVSAVWYNRTHPVGDLPLPIHPPNLYLGSCYAAQPEAVAERGIRHVVRLGWGFGDWCRRAPAREVAEFLEGVRGEGVVGRGVGSLGGTVVWEPDEEEHEEDLDAAKAVEHLATVSPIDIPNPWNHGATLAVATPPTPTPAPAVAPRPHTVIYHDFPIEDSPREPIRKLFAETSTIIAHALSRNEGVLVHCHAGVSRSATIVLAYLVRHAGLTLHEAWTTAYAARPIVRPNEGFARALQELEREVWGFEEASVPVFWMAESYAYFMDVLEMRERLEAWEGVREGKGGEGRTEERRVDKREE